MHSNIKYVEKDCPKILKQTIGFFDKVSINGIDVKKEKWKIDVACQMHFEQILFVKKVDK